MTAPQHPPVSRELTADEIPWDLRPIDLALDGEDDLLTTVLLEAESYRVLATAAIHELAGLHADYNQLKNRYHAVLDAHRSQPK